WSHGKCTSHLTRGAASQKLASESNRSARRRRAQSTDRLPSSAFVRTYERTGGPRRRAATVPASSKLSRQEKPMRTATTRPRALPTLYVAFELGNTEWVLAMTTGVAQPPLRRVLPARALTTLRTELGR